MNDEARSSIHFFGAGQAAAGALPEAEVVGAKAQGLMRLDRAGLPVPPGFVLGTGYCAEVLAAGGLTERLRERLAASVRRLEDVTGRRLGSARRPLLLAVRSGAPVSMPGMLDTVLDVGLSGPSLEGLVAATGNPRLAWDCYRRLLESWATVVIGLPAAPFVRALRRRLDGERFASARDLDALEIRGLAEEALELIEEHGCEVPRDPAEQLERAVAAVFESWRGERAVEYRRLHGIDEEAGTAVTVQAMVFGNAGPRSGAGVGFTRDPSSGENALYLDFLFEAQGEDVVSGRHAVTDTERLGSRLPDVRARLEHARRALERELGDLQDFEFTVEEGTLYLLQTRPGKRTPRAALRIAVDMVHEGLIEPAQALERLAPYDLEAIETVRVAGEGASAVLGTGVPASAGVATGRIALDPARARDLAAHGEPPILVREAVSTTDLCAMSVAAGLLTAAGGRTSHAAVVARQMNLPCVVGCRDLVIDAGAGRCRIGERVLAEGDEISVDANTGRVHAGRVRVVRERPVAELREVESWRRGAAA